jgi:hypothetical protein
MLPWILAGVSAIMIRLLWFLFEHAEHKAAENPAVVGEIQDGFLSREKAKTTSAFRDPNHDTIPGRLIHQRVRPVPFTPTQD